MNKQIIVVIRCYNEAKRIDTESYIQSLAKLPQIIILFVNDGSTDDTLNIILNLKNHNPKQIKVLDLKKNSGKATAVFMGITEALHNSQQHLGYIDADLAVSLEEFAELYEVAKRENKDFVFGSRWKRVGSNISRKTFRHYTGRIFATIASNILSLDVYDTQCGAKIFTKNAAALIFAKPFSVNWISDVEIFFRLQEIFSKDRFDELSLEVPLNNWRDVEGSKVKLSPSIQILSDFIILRRLYK